MPIFMCEQCGCIENTACSGYWSRKECEDKRALCSECDPNIGKWHGMFERQSVEGLVLASDGFLYGKEDVASESFAFRMKHQNLKVVGEYVVCEKCKGVGDEVISGGTVVSCSGCGGTGIALKEAK